MKQDKISFIKNISIFNGLSDQQLRKVADICKEIIFDTGKTIMREGDTGDTMYIFIEGEVSFSNTATLKIPKKGFDKAETIGGKLNAKFVPFFGDMALFEDAPRSATISAITQCILYEIKRSDFENICASDMEMGYKILKNIIPVISGRVRKTTSDIVKLTTLLTIVLSKKNS